MCICSSYIQGKLLRAVYNTNNSKTKPTLLFYSVHWWKPESRTARVSIIGPLGLAPAAIHSVAVDRKRPALAARSNGRARFTSIRHPLASPAYKLTDPLDSPLPEMNAVLVLSFSTFGFCQACPQVSRISRHNRRYLLHGFIPRLCMKVQIWYQEQ